MPEPLVYRATEQAAESMGPIKPLDGTLEAAQAYVDKVTGSSWWSKYCEPSWMGDEEEDAVPVRVQMIEIADENMGACALQDRLYWFDGDRCPRIEIGHDRLYGDLRAIEDRWVILHELAHIWNVKEKGWHGQQFCYAFHTLVYRWLGREHADALKAAFKEQGIRLDYRLI